MIGTGASSTREYRLVRLLGSGGMAQVVEAVARGEGGFERRVAIKWMLPDVASDESTQRMFLDEARISSHLHHANVVQVLDFGSMEGGEFIVYEFVDGLDMHRARQLAGGQVPASVALHVIGEVAHALHYAHGLTDAVGTPLGIVHRDVSPGNVLVSWGGDVKLADFGIALATFRQERTVTGMIKGKASYLAPELVEGTRATPASDVCSLGLTLDMLITGCARRHFGMAVGSRAEVELPHELEQLVQRCIQTDPAQRPTAAEVAEASQALRRAMTSTSGRRELADWLAGLDYRAPKARPVDLLAGRILSAADPGARQFVLTDPAVPIPTRRDVPRLASGAEAPAGDGATPARTRRLRWLVGLAMAALGASLGFAVFALVLPSPREPTVTEAKAPPAASRASGAGGATEPGTRDGGSDRSAGPIATAETPSPGPADAGAASGEGAVGSHPATRRSAAAPGRRRLEAAPEGRTETARGSVAVGGFRLVRGRCFIDGRYVGEAPGLFTVPVGAHHLVVRGQDGAVLHEQSFEVRSDHLGENRLRILVN